MNDFEEEEIEYAIRPNKSQIKRDIAELHKLVDNLIHLSSNQLKELELAENLYEAIIAAAAMPLKGARKRQLKFITGQLRKIEVEPLLEKLACIENKSAHATREHHMLERWRDRFLQEGDAALSEFLRNYPTADSQQLRLLIRNAKKEIKAEKPPKSSRQIYQYLKNFLLEH
jgi:ribosome-associated protein